MGDILLSGASQGLIWAILALGVFISYRILDVADLSCEGSITLGASVAALLIYRSVHPLLAIFLAFLSGCVAGIVTGILHTKLKIPAILSGILTMISLYSINIRIMSFASGAAGTANLSLLTKIDNTLYTGLTNFLRTTPLQLNKTYVSLIIGVLFCVVIVAVLYWFFGTELGSALRATGNNEKMCRAQGIDTDLTKIIGLALGNGLIAMSGALLCQYQGNSDVNMGIGSIVIGLASIIIGEAIFARANSFLLTLTGIVVGSVIYRIVVAMLYYFNMPASDLKLMTAIVVIVALCLPALRKSRKKSRKKESAGKAGQTNE